MYHRHCNTQPHKHRMQFVFLQALHALCISAAHPAVTLRVAVTEIDEKP